MIRPPRVFKGGQGLEVHEWFSIVGAYSFGSLVQKFRDCNDSSMLV